MDDRLNESSGKFKRKRREKFKAYSLVSEGCEWTEKGERERNWDK